MSRRTKIVATVGPACESPGMISGLIAAGVDVFRLNLSHGSLAEHRRRLQDVREAAAAVGATIAVLADLPGPKVRAGQFPDGGVFLAEGAAVRLVPGAGPCSGEEIAVDYPTLLEDVRPGDVIVFGDGAITVQVEDVGPASAHVRVLSGGRVQGRPGVHLPSPRLRMGAPTAADLELAAAMAADGVDYLAVSFVRRAVDIEKVRLAAGAARGAAAVPWIVAKIETRAAVANLAEVVEAADAVMVARGDLGIECPLEDVPHLQKRIITACIETGTPVITATQMLESMVHAPAPTRAEVSDVANAVFDGTDAVMLSAETAIGHDPALVVATMARICLRAESEPHAAGPAFPPPTAPQEGLAPAERVTRAMAAAAGEVARAVGAQAILCRTRTGRTALAMARSRPRTALVAASPDPAVARRMALVWGVLPMVVRPTRSTDDLVWALVEAAGRAGALSPGDIAVVLSGAPDLDGDATDVLRVVTVPEAPGAPERVQPPGR